MVIDLTILFFLLFSLVFFNWKMKQIGIEIFEFERTSESRLILGILLVIATRS